MSSRFAKGASKLAIVRASGDWILGGLGVGAATASASFAAYMLAFGPNELVPGGDFTIFASYDRRPQVAQAAAGPTHGSRAADVVAEGLPVRAGSANADANPVDFTPTGSIAPAAEGPAAPKGAPRPGPDGRSLPAFNLRDVFDGQALVESRSSISVVKPGSMLDGAGEVLSIEKRGEHWVVLTANGIIAQRR